MRLSVNLYVAIGTEKYRVTTAHRRPGENNGVGFILATHTLRNWRNVYRHGNRITAKGFDEQTFDFVDSGLRLGQHIYSRAYGGRRQGDRNTRDIDARERVHKLDGIAIDCVAGDRNLSGTNAT